MTAALLNHAANSVENPLFEASRVHFNAAAVYPNSTVKPEPFDSYVTPPVSGIDSSYLARGYCNGFNVTSMNGNLSYTNMMPLQNLSSGSPLPLCPVPTEETIDNVFYTSNGSLDHFSRSLLSQQHAVTVLKNVSKDIPDPMEFCTKAAEQMLNSHIRWAQNDTEFRRLSVSFSPNLYPSTKNCVKFKIKIHMNINFKDTYFLKTIY